MRIEVTGRAFSTQTRAYAEYRVFSSLARFSDVRDVKVSLSAPAAGAGTVVCAVAIVVEPGTRARVSARGRHAYDAIDRAAERAGDVLRRHSQVAISS